MMEAELCRLRASCLLLRQIGTRAEAESWLLRALDVARRQEAKSLELRAAMSLGRLWHQNGKRQEARDLLAPVYVRPRRCSRNSRRPLVLRLHGRRRVLFRELGDALEQDLIRARVA